MVSVESKVPRPSEDQFCSASEINGFTYRMIKVLGLGLIEFGSKDGAHFSSARIFSNHRNVLKPKSKMSPKLKQRNHRRRSTVTQSYRCTMRKIGGKQLGVPMKTNKKVLRRSIAAQTCEIRRLRFCSCFLKYFPYFACCLLWCCWVFCAFSLFSRVLLRFALHCN